MVMVWVWDWSVSGMNEFGKRFLAVGDDCRGEVECVV